jgi:hypothetical protein
MLSSDLEGKPAAAFKRGTRLRFTDVKEVLFRCYLLALEIDGSERAEI